MKQKGKCFVQWCFSGSLSRRWMARGLVFAAAVALEDEPKGGPKLGRPSHVCGIEGPSDYFTLVMLPSDVASQAPP